MREGRTFRERFGNGALGGANPSGLVSTPLLADVLQEFLNDETATSENQPSNLWNGALYRLCRGASLNLPDSTPEGIVRRLWSVLHNESDSVSARWADGVFLAAGHYLRDYDVPEFPSCRAGAQEMVNVWMEECSGECEDPDALAYQLLRFTVGFLRADEICDPEIAKMREATRAAVRDRKRRKDEREKRELAEITAA